MSEIRILFLILAVSFGSLAVSGCQSEPETLPVAKVASTPAASSQAAAQQAAEPAGSTTTTSSKNFAYIK